MKIPAHRALLCALVALWGVASACAPRESGEADGTATASEPTVPYNPTSEGSLPAAILGTADPPQGLSLQYFDGDPAATGYLAVPAGPGPFPATILIHEWNGLVDRVRQVADALAAEGYPGPRGRPLQRSDR